LAVLAAPAFSLLYAYLFDHFSEDYFWLLQDPKSLLLLVFFYPLIEELSFRGVLQGTLSQYPLFQKNYLQISLSNIFTSLLFAGIHLVYHSPLMALLIFFPSLIFGYFRDMTSGVIMSIILHMVYNFCFLSITGN